jgi:hypothetical protein
MKNYDRKEINHYSDGDNIYYLNDKLHRTNGPSIEYKCGSKSWFLYGDRHNDKGPATIYNTGGKFWFLNDNSQTLSNTTTTLKPQIFQYNINEELQ